MAVPSSKRFWDVALTDPASEHEHRPIRRKLNNSSSVPSIVIDIPSSGSAGDHHVDQDHRYRAGNYSSSSTSTIGLVPSPSPDSNMSCQSFNASISPAPPGISTPDLLSPLRMPRSPNHIPEIKQERFNSSPSLTPSGMQMLSLDSGDVEMDLDSQTGDDIDWERDCNMIELSHPGSLATTEKIVNTQQQPKELCFGMIFATMQVTHEMNTEEQFINTGKGFDIYRRQKGYYVVLSPLKFKEMGLIDLETERCLQSMSDISSLRLKGHILPPEEAARGGTGTSGKKKFHKTPTASGKEKRRITITIYGSHQVMSTVGKILSSKRKYLQEPDHIDSEHGVYQNPHEYTRLESEHEASNERWTSHSIQLNNLDTSMEDSNLVSTILDSITPRATLVEDTEADCISTQLLSHQKEALCFTRQQESENVLYDGLWETRQKGLQHIYSHNIINMSQIDTPLKLRGGILADEMGLGKTLTMLATIVRSLTEARSATQTHGHSSGMGQARLSATLIILPLSLMAEWENEITKHTIPGTIKYHKYHAQAKVPLEQLVEFDIIFTTYHTLNLEFARGSSPLFNAEWFRVILDEAHHIRNNTTQTFRAVMALSAQRRWCLTGTPTQNRLGDLFSLLMFLKIPHFETKALLKRYIVNLLKVNDMKGVENLRTLLSACCLRRKKSILPQSIAVSEIPRLLDMSSAETIRYQKIKDDCKRVIDIQVCSGRSSKAYLSILQSITQLRLLCNHGIFQRIASPKGRTGVLHDQAMDVDSAEENVINQVELLESFEAMEQDTCANCDTKIVSLIPTHTAGAGYLTRCSHLICAICRPQVLFMTGRDGAEQYCNLCGETSGTNHVHTFDNIPVNPLDEGPFYSAAVYNPDLTIPTKIGALFADIEANPATEKSIVFSGWTQTLDLVETHLRDRKIDFRRVDGKVNALSRAAILQDFRVNPNVSVLLLTTGCGAVGLNLTAATRVHIIEPQWNPMVEKQAIGRVVRLGQSQPVSIYRYIMKGTIEESMVSRQFQKTQLAELICGAGSTEDMIGSMKDLQQLL